jgi:enamine deaminase RidA (YjgF/YER057c/UK114 family)
MTPDGLVGGGDLYAQTKQTLKTIAWALGEAGMAMTDVVRVTTYVTDISRWEEAGRALGESFGDIRPAATMVELRAPIDPAMLIEIEVDAYRP